MTRGGHDGQTDIARRGGGEAWPDKVAGLGHRSWSLEAPIKTARHSQY